MSTKKFFLFLLRTVLGPTKFFRLLGLDIHSTSRLLTWKVGSEAFLVSIGAHSTIASDVYLLTHDHSLKLLHGITEYRPILIGDRCFIGVNSTIMPGVIVSSNVIVGAGSVLTKSVPPNVVVAGNPARIIKYLEPQSISSPDRHTIPRSKPCLISQEYFDLVTSSLNISPRPFLK